MYYACVNDRKGTFLSEDLTHCFLPVQGSSEKFPVTVRPVNNFPIDIYLLMDLSFSMEDDLANLKRLGTQLGMY